MGRDKWDDFGDGMDDLIQKAIDSGNYNSLGRDINDVIRKAAFTFEDAINKGFTEAKNRNVKINLGGNSVEVDKTYQDRIRRPKAELKKSVAAENKKLYISDNRLFAREAAGIIGGGFMSFGLGIGFLSVLADSADFISIVVLGVLLSASVWWFADGIKTFKNHRIFKNYRKVLEVSDSKSFASIEDLMLETGESRNKTLRRLREMIKKRWFKEGHIDKNQTTLISTNETYAIYQKTQSEYEQRKRIEEELGVGKAKKESAAAVDGEVKEVLEAGQRYLAQISHLNDIIPGLEVSGKIFKIEDLTGRILRRVEEHPSSVEDVKKLMKYYLPMTIKLLTAYAEMDKQQIRGQNIDKSKKEIEDVLDSLHEAFEKLLNDLYKETAWDVSSDVSVLNAMLKREGLKGSDFENGAKAQNTADFYSSETAEKDKEGIKLEL